MERNKQGQFINNDNNKSARRYKQVLHNGIQMSEHSRILCILLGIDRIPKHMVVHHMDGDTMNNDSDNLILMSVTAHNRLHPADTETEIKDRSMINKLLKKTLGSRKGSHIMRECKPVYDLLTEGNGRVYVAEILNISKSTVSLRFDRYLEYLAIIEDENITTIKDFIKIKRLKTVKNKSWLDISKILNQDIETVKNKYNTFLNKQQKKND